MAGGRQALLRQEANAIFPGGIAGPDAGAHGDGRPAPVLDAGKGARVRDMDGTWYVDYAGGNGSAILGHGHPDVLDAVREAAFAGLAPGGLLPLELELAHRLRAAVPVMELLRFAGTGAEAVAGAVRLARAATGRELVVRIAGGRRGGAEGLAAVAGPGLVGPGLPDSPGVTAGSARDTIVIPFNDPVAVAQVFERYEHAVAALLVEPVLAHAGLIQPTPDYLGWLRELATSNGALLVFDETTTGFRIAHGSAGAAFGIIADLVVLGGVIGGGIPLGAFGGAADLLRRLAPDGPVLQPGEAGGRSLAIAAGVATLDRLTPDVYAQLERTAARLEVELHAIAGAAAREISITRAGSMLGLGFRRTPARNAAEAEAADLAAHERFAGAMLDHGVLLPASPLDPWFISAAHGETDVAATLAAAKRSFAIA